MGVIGGGTTPMFILGIITGIIGIVGTCVNYPIYTAMLNSRKNMQLTSRNSPKKSLMSMLILLPKKRQSKSIMQKGRIRPFFMIKSDFKESIDHICNLIIQLIPRSKI